MTGLDDAAAAIDLGRKRFREAGMVVIFVLDDLTRVRHIRGTFDLLVDYGVLDDLTNKERD